MELGNVVSFWSYREVETSESLHERGRMVHARACARELVDWVFSRFELHDPLGDPVDGKVKVYWVYLVHHAQLLVAYKEQATDNGMDWSGQGQCLPGDVKSAVERCFAHEHILQRMYAAQKLKTTTFAWPGPVYAVRKRPSPTKLKGSCILLYFRPLTAYLWCRVLPWLHGRRFELRRPSQTSAPRRHRYAKFCL